MQRLTTQFLAGLTISLSVAIGVASAGTPPRSSAPFPFLGNGTVLNFDASQTGFQRETNCSISLGTLRASQGTSVANFQSTLRGWAGLSATTGSYPLGCKDSSVGVSSQFLATYLGESASGQCLAAFAGLGNDDELVLVSGDPGSYTYKSTTLAVNAGSEVLAVDVNGDGNLDLIANQVSDPTSGHQGIGVFISNGDGTFKAPVVYTTTTGAVDPFMVVDLNGDGVPDLVFVNEVGSNTQITTLLGHADGTFTAGSSIAVSQGVNALASGDFNGDGKTDVIVGNQLLLGKGDGSFTLASGTLPFNASSYAVGDFNGDGKLDVAAYGPLTIYLGQGNGTFTAGATYDSPPEGLQSIYATDLDGDGKLDLVVGTISNGAYVPSLNLPINVLQVLFGKGDGTFTGAPLTAISSLLTTADVTGAGNTDVVIANSSGGISVLPGTGSGTFGTAINSTTNFELQAAASGVLTGNSHPDLVGVGQGVSGNITTVAVLNGSGTGSFSAEADYALPEVGSVSSIAIADFNHDGHPDIAIALETISGNGSGVYVLLGQANGTFAAATQVDSTANALIAAGDLNGDGNADLVVVGQGANYTAGGGTTVLGSIHVYLGPSFTASTVTIPPTLFFSGLALADMNGDGKLDIVTAGTDTDSNTQVDVLLGNGAGAFGTIAQSFISQGSTDPTPAISVADFNGDGKPDVAFAIPGTFTGILLGKGDGTFSVQSNLGIGVGDHLYTLNVQGNANPGLLVLSSTAGGLISLVNQSGQVNIASPVQFAFTLSPNAGSVSAGSAASTTLSPLGLSGYTGSVTFSCGGLPAGANCQFSGGATATGSTNTLTITTTVRTASAVPSRGAPLQPWWPGGVVLAGLLLPMVTRRVATTPLARSMVIALVGAFILLGCGGSSSPSVSSRGSSSTSGGSSSTSSSGTSSSGSSSSSSSSSSGGSYGSSSGASSSSSGSGSSSGGTSGGTSAGTYRITVTGNSGSTTQTQVYTLTVS